MIFHVILGSRVAVYSTSDSVPLPQFLDFVEAKDPTDGKMFFGIVKQRKLYLNNAFAEIYLENIT
jgi:hypothetical protein